MSVVGEVDEAFRSLAQTEHLPGLAYGIVLDQTLVHTGAVGFANLELKLSAGPQSAFRIASMTKSFIALALYKLRDDGKLSLDDPAAKYLPEFRKVRPPTADSAPVTIRCLMSMSGGLPEDNPWGDRQMAISQKALREFVEGGLSFSNPPATEYEYSNLGFVLLGRVITRAAHEPFQRYITERILKPLGMNQTRWEFADYSPSQFAPGYRWEHDAWQIEPILHDGEGAACGGIITTLSDFARYTAMHLDAWPARNEGEKGPVRRATIRELDTPETFIALSGNAKRLDGTTPNPSVSFYGHGLAWSADSQGRVALSHSGGLPGYGSNYRFLPDYGLAVIALANRTYAPASKGVSKAVEILLDHGKLLPREVRPSPILQRRKTQVAEWVLSWDQKLGDEIAADNFFLDHSREDWMKTARDLFNQAGRIISVGELAPRNQLRGTFPMNGEHGVVNVWFTLTPERDPKVQELKLTFSPAH